ncbi:MAG: indole-3-glycerol-phosphate synthase [Thermoproteota archaeon]|nr:indole-3-glycerol-phosphate synthase [Thermoproteota archaeon]
MTRNDLKFSGNSILTKLVRNSFKAIEEGSYELPPGVDHTNHTTISLKKQILNCKHVPLVTEIKFSSPSKGTLVKRNGSHNIETIVSEMERGHSSGISILTQPFLFDGSISHILKARRNTHLPILMKDVIVSDVQISSAKKIGADCVLLIKTIFDKNMTEGSLEKFSEQAKKLGLEVIVETHQVDEFEESVTMNKKGSNKMFDIIGINNRNLDTLAIDLDNTKKILSSCIKGNNLVLAESGIYSKEHILSLREAGADAFLVGTSLMENVNNIGNKISELYLSY